jgi:small subunit ribosomal protein S15
MALKKDDKQALIKKFARDESDTGSVEVQVAILTQEINQLTDHLNQHIHDFHSKKGLLIKVGKRRSLLNYLFKHDVKRYRELIKELNIRK